MRNSSHGGSTAHPLAGRPVPSVVKGTLEPPSFQVQQAIWEAEARQPVRMSRAEVELRQEQPPASAPELERLAFLQDLSETWRANPVSRRFPYLGKFIRCSWDMPQGTPLPYGMRCWWDFVPVRWFDPLDERPLYQQQDPAFGLPGTSPAAVGFFRRGSCKAPGPAKDVGEYVTMVDRHQEFMIASGRWSSHEATAARVHVGFVVKLFGMGSAAAATRYDDDFRKCRHYYQDMRWCLPDYELLEKARRSAGDSMGFI